MTEQTSTPSEWLAKLRTLRDEAQLKAHLGSMEMKGRLDQLDDQLESFAKRAEAAGGAAGEAGNEVGKAFSLLGETLAEGFKKVTAELRKH